MNLPEVPHSRPIHAISEVMLTVLFGTNCFWYWNVMKGITALVREGEKRINQRQAE
jgi:hypothetical protein